MVIRLIAEGTVDEDALRSTRAKAVGQESMMEAVKARLKKYTAYGMEGSMVHEQTAL